jgi:citrate synthase
MNDNDPATPAWLSAEQAITLLGIARQTLYAYVSRGMIRTRPDPTDPRRGLYDPQAVETLLRRRRQGRARRAVAEATIDFGDPVLISRITQINDGTPWYRGRNAIRVAQTASLEETAALLWDAARFPPLPASTFHTRDPGIAADPPIARAVRHIADLAGSEAWASGGDAMLRDAALCLRTVGEAAVNAPAELPLHRHLAHAWRVDEEGTDLIRRALVLCADHELNASAFAVRVVASTGATLPHCVLAGLAALSGPLHGGMTSRVRAMLAESRIMADPRATVSARLARGEDLPGFGHRLYPDGDPRATALLDLIGPAPRWRGLFAAILAQTGHRPNIDAALVALEQHLALPEGSALAIFAVGRTAGWIAHALEQRAEGQLIRPRSTYIGLPPGR